MTCPQCGKEQSPAAMVPWSIDGKSQEVCGKCAWKLYAADNPKRGPGYSSFNAPLLKSAQKAAV